MTSDEAITVIRKYHGFRHPALEAALVLARENEELRAALARLLEATGSDPRKFAHVEDDEDVLAAAERAANLPGGVTI